MVRKGARDASDKQKERWAEVVVDGGTDERSTTCDEAPLSACERTLGREAAGSVDAVY